MIEEATKEVTLRIDEASFLKSIKYTFANHDSCVKELIQNARRAGATKVEIQYDEKALTLVVKDDGCGVADFQQMMTKCLSGWDAKTQEEERPYGLGFLSAISAAKRVTVKSNGTTMSFESDQALSKQPIKVFACDHTQGTIVTLEGFEWMSCKSAIESMARGYHLPIIFDGKELDRPHALDGKYVKTSVGMIRLYEDVPHALPRIYLQGFCVSEQSFSAYAPIVHLDPKKFFGQAPDRNVVIDQQQMLESVAHEIRALYVDKLNAMRFELTDEQFCEQAYRLACSLDRTDVFNGIDYIPAKWLDKFNGVPHESFAWERFVTSAHEDEKSKGYTLQDIESGQVKIASLSAPNRTEQEIARWMLAYKADAFILDVHLHPDHWLHKHLFLTDDDVVTLEVKGEHARFDLSDVSSHYLCGYMVLVQALELQGPRGMAYAVDEPLFFIDADSLYVPDAYPTSKGIKPQVLSQALDYVDEFDRAEEDERNEDAGVVSRLLRQMRAGSEQERVQIVLQAALRGHREEIRNCEVTLRFDENGNHQLIEHKAIAAGA